MTRAWPWAKPDTGAMREARHMGCDRIILYSKGLVSPMTRVRPGAGSGSEGVNWCRAIRAVTDGRMQCVLQSVLVSHPVALHYENLNRSSRKKI